MNYTDKEISDLIEESQWQIDSFERPSAHNSKLMINVIKHLQSQAKNNEVLDLVRSSLDERWNNEEDDHWDEYEDPNVVND